MASGYCTEQHSSEKNSLAVPAQVHILTGLEWLPTPSQAAHAPCWPLFHTGSLSTPAREDAKQRQLLAFFHSTYTPKSTANHSCRLLGWRVKPRWMRCLVVKYQTLGPAGLSAV